ncbi:hypothetical protein FB45DRAFT_1029485 [Roridomyces roridus]|uniref:Uncharacterized protein n=1 Tax=Roridomyces roridus TaxID=1738132 RepID=A0AAD7BQ22_9AGAR|nr:hypothetical protein FB45DRAFT_1029485 [Roridomyces roridus]
MPFEPTNSFSSRFPEEEDDNYSPPLPTRPGSPSWTIGESLQHLHLQAPQRPRTPGPSRTQSSFVRPTYSPLRHANTSHRLPLVQNPHPHQLPQSDWWHLPPTGGRPARRVGRPPSYQSLSFRSVQFDPDPQHLSRGQRNLSGVSMELALQRCAHMSNGDEKLRYLLPFTPTWKPILRIQWPGYDEMDLTRNEFRSLSVDLPLILDPEMRMKDLAQQLAQYYYNFATNELYAETVSGPPYHLGLIPLGAARAPNTVNFNRLRMVKLWSNDSLFWTLEVVIVHDYVANGV